MRALLAEPAAGALRARGDASGAKEIASEGADARQAVGLDSPSARGSGTGDPGRLGLELALSGKFQPVGEAALRAAMLATGTPAAPTMQLEVRDPGADRLRAQQRLDDLAADAVIGVVMAFDLHDDQGAVPLTTAEGVPLLMLDNNATAALPPSAFTLVHPSSARAAALARKALELGARSFALVGPDTSAGKALRAAFKQAVTEGGGHAAADASYPPGSTSFTAVVATIKKAQPQVVFVADGADRLELIAPALAAANLWAAPWGAPRPAGAPGKPRPRNVLLLSTAADLSPRLLQSSGRYVQGALLAPGFYAGADDPRARAFVDAYRVAYGQDPHATEAYAYDGVNAIRAAIAAGAKTRGDLLRALAEGTFQGLTGALRFGAGHERANPPVVYVVDGADIKPLH